MSGPKNHETRTSEKWLWYGSGKITTPAKNTIDYHRRTIYFYQLWNNHQRWYCHWFHAGIMVLFLVSYVQVRKFEFSRQNYEKWDIFGHGFPPLWFSMKIGLNAFLHFASSVQDKVYILWFNSRPCFRTHQPNWVVNIFFFQENPTLCQFSCW